MFSKGIESIENILVFIAETALVNCARFTVGTPSLSLLWSKDGESDKSLPCRKTFWHNLLKKSGVKKML
jgi:hypothetical protein